MKNWDNSISVDASSFFNNRNEGKKGSQARGKFVPFKSLPMWGEKKREKIRVQTLLALSMVVTQ
jgi:hypothetical protein